MGYRKVGHLEQIGYVLRWMIGGRKTMFLTKEQRARRFLREVLELVKMAATTMAAIYFFMLLFGLA